MVGRNISAKERLLNNKQKCANHIGSGTKKRGISTITEYVRRIAKLHSLLHPGMPFKSHKFLHWEVEKVIKTINGLETSDNSKLGYYSAALSIYPEGVENASQRGKVKYQLQFNRLKKKVRDNSEKQERSEKEEERWVTQEQIAEARKVLLNKYLKTDHIRDMYRYVILSLYTILPPRRALDYCEMKVNPPKEIGWEGNECITRKKKFVKFIFRKFKMSNTKGAETFDRKYVQQLPNGKDCLILLDSWAKINSSEWFLGRQCTSNHFSKIVRRVSKAAFGHMININVFRKIYVSNFLKKNPFLEEKKLVSKFMGHDVSTQMIYYRKREYEHEDLENLSESEDDRDVPEDLRKLEKIEKS